MIKKVLIIMTMAFGFCAFSFADSTESQYKVYDVKLSMKTTKASGTEKTSCGDTYVYRTKGNRVIKGVIAGCGCEAAAGDPTCQNFVMFFWDETSKTQLTNYTYKTELLQRIDKEGKKVEQVVSFTVDTKDGKLYELLLAGFGTYKAGKEPKNDTMSTSGNIAGWMEAPYKVTAGSCTACSTTPDTVDQTTAIVVCESGTCKVSPDSKKTPVCGTYTMKLNKKKVKKCEKNGVSNETLGLPSYVKVM